MPQASYQCDEFRSYLNKICQYPLLTAAQERELAKQVAVYLEISLLLGQKMSWSEIAERRETSLREIQRIYRTSTKARETFINSNLRLVVSIARKYLNRGMDLPT